MWGITNYSFLLLYEYTNIKHFSSPASSQCTHNPTASGDRQYDAAALLPAAMLGLRH